MVPRKEIFLSRKFNVTQLLYYGCHHMWRMPQIHDCNVTFGESFAKVPRELRESWGWDLKGGARSFSQLPHFHTYSLPFSLSYSHSLNLSPHSVTLSQSLSSSIPLSLSLSLSHSCCLSFSISLYLSLSLSLALSIYTGIHSLWVCRGCNIVVGRAATSCWCQGLSAPKPQTTPNPQTGPQHIELDRKSYDELQEVLFNPEVKLAEFDFCHTHGRQCRRIPKPAGPSERHKTLSIGCAGSPCPDWSLFGKHGGETGASAHLFVTLCLCLHLA